MENYFVNRPFGPYPIKTAIDDINKTQFQEVFGKSPNLLGDYNTYISTRNYKTKVRGNVVLVLLPKRFGRNVDDNFIARFTELIMQIMEGVLSRKKDFYSPYIYQKLDDNRFSVSEGGSPVYVSVKRFFDPYVSQTKQINDISNYISQLVNNSGGNNVEFRIKNDIYTINLNQTQSTQDLVEEIGGRLRTDVAVRLNLGGSYPSQVKISLKGDTYRQFSGVSEFMGRYPIVDNFIAKVKQEYEKNNSKYQKMFMEIKYPNPLINEAIFGLGQGQADYLMKGGITLNGNTLSASEVVKRGQYMKSLYLVSSMSDINSYGIPKVRIGIYDNKFGGADIDASTIKLG